MSIAVVRTQRELEDPRPLTRYMACFILFAVFPSRYSCASRFPVCSRFLIVAVVRTRLVDLKSVYPRYVRLRDESAKYD